MNENENENTGCMMVVSFSGTSISRNMAFDIYLRSKWNADLRASPVREMPGLCFMIDFSRR